MTSEIVSRRADELIRELGIEHPNEIDVEAIAQYCGATVVYEKLTGCEARIIGVKNEAIITVNSTSPIERQRFSGAHELGHWMYHRGTSSFGCTSDQFANEWSKYGPEQVANRFASELLMPENIFGTAVRKKAISFETVKAVASDFRTSLTATAIRLIQCGSFPAMVVCSENGDRQWFVRGVGVPEELWPLEKIGKKTLAVKGVIEPRPQEIRADEWISHSDSYKYYLSESNIRIGSKMLSLIWWEDEEQLANLNVDDE